MGFPHSEIFGSKCAGNSPKLIAACHVLHRLSVPRHPPNALVVLDLTTVVCQRRSISRSFFGSFRAGDDPHDENGLVFYLPVPTTPPRFLCHRHRKHSDGARKSRLQTSLSDEQCQRTIRCHCIGCLCTCVMVVEADGIEPTTSCLQSRRSPN